MQVLQKCMGKWDWKVNLFCAKIHLKSMHKFCHLYLPRKWNISKQQKVFHCFIDSLNNYYAVLCVTWCTMHEKYIYPYMKQYLCLYYPVSGVRKICAHIITMQSAKQELPAQWCIPTHSKKMNMKSQWYVGVGRNEFPDDLEYHSKQLQLYLEVPGEAL